MKCKRSISSFTFWCFNFLLLEVSFTLLLLSHYIQLTIFIFIGISKMFMYDMYIKCWQHLAIIFDQYIYIYKIRFLSLLCSQIVLCTAKIEDRQSLSTNNTLYASSCNHMAFFLWSCSKSSLIRSSRMLPTHS